MSLNNNQFTVRWQDQNKQEKSKTYDDYDTATKAYKWLIASGADGVDIAIVQRIKPPKADIDQEPSSLPYID